MKWTRGWRGPFILASLLLVGPPISLFVGLWISGTRGEFIANVLFFGAISLLIGVFVAKFAIERRQRELLFRQQNGLCLKCGYDLRESKERCPECGAPRKKTTAT